MQPFLAQFPFSDQPRRFAWVLAAATGIGLAVFLVGLALSPVPAQPTDAFTGGARVTVTLPDGATLLHAADILDPLFADEARSLRDFSSRHPELAAALTATHGGTLTMYGPGASGTAQFVLALQNSGSDRLIRSLARSFPKEISYRLPDGRIARELVADPDAAEARLRRVPGTDWLLFGSVTSSLPFAFREENGNLEITTFPVESLIRIASVLPSSRSFCLEGVPAAVPFPLERRWDIIRMPFPGLPTPLVAPRPISPLPIDGVTTKYRNYCEING